MKPKGHGWSSFFCLSIFLLSFTAGCRNNDVVEMALRAREQDVRTLKEEVLRMQAYNEALLKELHTVRNFGSVNVTPELAAQTYTLKRITLGRGTSGRDDDKQPGDEAIFVVIEPRDSADDIIKAPGSAQIFALEISTEGLKTPFSSWTISPEQLRQSWKQGLFTNGYSLTLPLQQAPKNKNVRIIVRFQLIDGRVFEADKDITVNPGPMIIPNQPPMMPPADPNLSPKTSEPVVPKFGEPLPTPKEYKQTPLPKDNKQPPAPPGPLQGPIIQPTGNWQAPSLNGAVKMLRPEPLYPSVPDTPQ